MPIRGSALAVCGVLAIGAGCAGERPAPVDGTQALELPAGDWFVDRTEDSGLKFTHVNGMSGKLYYAEIIGPGAAMLDYDNDGDLDVYLVQGRMLDSSAERESKARPSAAPLKGRLFRNDLAVNQDGTRSLRFTDVTEASGINARGYGIGVAAADYTNDGCVDVYLTNLGANTLFRNNCDSIRTNTIVVEAFRPSVPA